MRQHLYVYKGLLPNTLMARPLHFVQSYFFHAPTLPSFIITDTTRFIPPQLSGSAAYSPKCRTQSIFLTRTNLPIPSTPCIGLMNNILISMVKEARKPTTGAHDTLQNTLTETTLIHL